MSSVFSIGGHALGGGRAFVIAELAWAHDGSLEKARRIVEGAAKAGANGFNVHLTSLADYMTPTYGDADAVSAGKPTSQIFDYLSSINLSFADVAEIARAIRAAGMSVLVMPNDLPSVQFARESIQPDAYTLSPACFAEEAYVRAVGACGRPVVLRIGGATLPEIERALEWLRAEGAENSLLLHGFQTYPTPLAETHLRAISTYAQIFGCPVGLADHIDGGDELALALPAAALPLGAVAFEKHITWDRGERGEDFESSLDPDQFARFVRIVRAAEDALGSADMPSAPLSPDILKYRRVVRKRLVASQPLPAGTTLGADHLACKRADGGLPIDERDHVIGRRTRVHIAKDAPITADDLS